MGLSRRCEEAFHLKVAYNKFVASLQRDGQETVHVKDSVLDRCRAHGIHSRDLESSKTKAE
jgi:hypothetical protein